MADKSRTIIAILIAVIVVMAVVLLYVFLISPSITGYVIGKQKEGFDFAVDNIVQLAAPPQCQIVPLQYGEGQIVNLVALECLQAQQEQMQAGE